MKAATLVVLASVAFVLAVPASATQGTSRATGSGHTLVNGERRTFSFTAQQKPDGSAVGMADINNRAIGEKFKVDVDCLAVAGNIAIMSGIISRHTDPNAVGLTGIFGVIDGGEGQGSTDAVSQVFFFLPNTITCLDIDPAEGADLAVPIVAGNVQVH